MTYMKSMPNADLRAVLKSEPALGLPIAEYHEALLRGPSPLTAGERELIGAYVSACNACEFCYGEHAAIAEAFGLAPGLVEDLLSDLDAAPVSDKFRAILVFVRKLNDTPGRMTAADAAAVHAAGWDDQALHHAVSICALFNFNNRLINGLGIPPRRPKSWPTPRDASMTTATRPRRPTSAASGARSVRVPGRRPPQWEISGVRSFSRISECREAAS